MTRDSGIGTALIALCGFLFWQTGSIPTPPFVPFGPAFYPRVILALLALLAVWLIVQDVSVSGRGRIRPGARATRQAPNYRLVFVCFVVFGVYVAGLSVIGFLAGTFFFVLALAWIIGPRRAGELPKLAVIAAGTALVTYLVFERYLHVFLPRGLLF
jgi:hypothetical protein